MQYKTLENQLVSVAFNPQINKNFRVVTATVTLDSNDPFTPSKIKSIKIDSASADGKWFGTSFSRQLKVIFSDPTINIVKGDVLTVKFSVPYLNTTATVKYAPFTVAEVIRDQSSGNLTVVGYDKMGFAGNIKWTSRDGSIRALAEGCASDLGLGNNAYFIGNQDPVASITHIWQATEIKPTGSRDLSVREIINAIAELTGTIAYINNKNELVFRGIEVLNEPEGVEDRNFIGATYSISKGMTFNFKSDPSQTLTGLVYRDDFNSVMSVGTRGDNSQIFYSNLLLVNLDPLIIQTTLEEEWDISQGHQGGNIAQKEYTPFTLSFIGNPALDFGDTLQIKDKNNTNVLCFYLGESLEYNGGLRGSTSWTYQPANNSDLQPTNISTSTSVIKSNVNQQNAKIIQTSNKVGMVVDNNGIKAGEICLAINNSGDSDAIISANKVHISGATYFNDLLHTGTTQIDGGSIYTDDLYVKKLGSQAGVVNIEVTSGSQLVLNGCPLKLEDDNSQPGAHLREISIDNNHNVNIYTDGYIQLQSNANVSGNLLINNDIKFSSNGRIVLNSSMWGSTLPSAQDSVAGQIFYYYDSGTGLGEFRIFNGTTWVGGVH